MILYAFFRITEIIVFSNGEKSTVGFLNITGLIESEFLNKSDEQMTHFQRTGCVYESVTHLLK